MSILKWLGLGDSASEGTDNTLHDIEKALEAHGPARARYLACFAYILTRAAKADHHVSDGEAHVMEQIVAERAGVDAEQAALIVRIARDAGHSRGTDDYLSSSASPHATRSLGCSIACSRSHRPTRRS
jgi:uncharacterized tellurite resistance protein B-like protein